MTFSDEIPVPADGDTAAKAQAMTQACAAYVEGPIREHTSDWHMMQRVFVDDLDPTRLGR